jgi:hypothetical protein
VSVLPNVGVIGSGPCGLLFSSILLQNGYSVSLLDIGSSEETSSNEIRSFKTLKLNGNSNCSYDINQFEKIVTHSNRKWFTSKSLLGFSQVWGGTWQVNAKEVDSNWNIAFQEIDKILNFNKAHLSIASLLDQCNCMALNFGSQKKFNNSTVKNYRTKILFKDFPHEQTVSKDFNIDQNLIWDASVLFQKCLSYKNFEYLNNFFVHDVTSTGSNVIIRSSDLTSLEFDFVALAGGPVSNSTILVRSNLVNQVILKDTRLIYVPFINLRPSPKHKRGFSHSLFSVDVLVDSKISYHLQFYSHLEKVLERIIVLIPAKLRVLFKYIIMYFSRYFGVILVYADKDLSQSISFAMDDGVVRALNLESKLNFPKLRLIKDLTPKLLHFGLIPLWIFSKFTTPGESYHLGSASGLEMNKDGSIQEFPNVFVLGTFALEDLHPGPVTKSAMAQAYLSAIELVRKLKLGENEIK